MSKPSKISTNVDFAAKGKQVGYLSAPHSRNDSGWGAARFPIACIANGGKDITMERPVYVNDRYAPTLESVILNNDGSRTASWQYRPGHF